MRKPCPYAKSDMTPCVLRDGEICFALSSHDEPICVGCERSPKTLGVPRPANWAKIVADYKRKHG
jgi:hypothetical protein